MKSVAAILGSVSAVHAGGERKLAGGGGYHYAQSGLKDISTGQDTTNVQWANYDLDDGKGYGSTPAPHEAFGAYNCRGYFQSPIDVPKKAMLREYNLSNSKKATTSGNVDNYAVDMKDSVYEHYEFPGADQPVWKRRMTGNIADKYVQLIDGTNTGHNKVYGLKISSSATDSMAAPTVAPLGVYRPLQFHWHFPSEHTVDGYAYPAELHIVHTRLSHFMAEGSLLPTKAGVFTAGTYAAPTDDACSKTANAGATLSTTAQLAASYNTAQDAAKCDAYSADHMPFLVLGFFLTDSPVKMHGNHDVNYKDALPVGADLKPDFIPVYTGTGVDAVDTVGNNCDTIYGAGTAEAARCEEAKLKIPALDKAAGGLEAAYRSTALARFVTQCGADFECDGTNSAAGNHEYTFPYKNTFGAAMMGRYYRYQGGLTTPPCTEGVEWVLFERPLYVHKDFFSHSFGTANMDNTGSATVAALYTPQGPKPIADLSKYTPVWLRNNRPTIPIHGRNVAFTQLTAFVNPAEPKFDGLADETTLTAEQTTTLNANGMAQAAAFNYLKPENMWDKKNCWTNMCVANADEADGCKKDADGAVVYQKAGAAAGTAALAGDAIERANCENQCENQQGAVGQYKGRQAPINIAGAEVYKGVTPVNHAWLAANTAGYVDSSMGSAQRWKLMNTGHGFNVVPQLSVAGGDASIKSTTDMSSNGVAIGTKPHTLHGGHRNLASYGAVAGKGYYVKKMNAAADAIEWFPLAQFHFHFPSENTVDGYQYDGEMHMVHVGDGSHVEALQKNVTAAGGPKSRVLQTKDAEGKDAVVFDVSDVSPRQLAAASSMKKSSVKVKGSSPKNHYDQAWINAVVLGFFLKVDDAHFMKLANGEDPAKGNPNMVQDMEKDSLMSAFGFKTDNGVPYTRGHYWTVDVENKKLAEMLFGPNVHGKQSLDSTPQYDMSAPSSRNYFNFMGGLTTPGCNEGVQFIIFTDPLRIRSSEMQMFKQNYWANNRPTQPRGDRVVLFNDFANAGQPLVGANKMTKVNPFAPKMDASSTTIYAVSSSGGAATNALSMLVATVMAGLALMM